MNTVGMSSRSSEFRFATDFLPSSPDEQELIRTEVDKLLAIARS